MTAPPLRRWSRTGWNRLWDRARGLPPLAVDIVIVIGCFLSSFLHTVIDLEATAGTVAFGLANALPLLWRRRFPLAVVMICGFTTTWMAVESTLGEFPAAQLVATYTVAALSPLMKRLLTIAGTAVGVSLSILIPHDELLAFGPVTIMFVVAYALGVGARARRDRITLLEERARRLAEERAAAATRERERIAREMHDILAHSMSLVVVQAEAGPVVVRADPDRAAEIFDTISTTTREALTQLRRALGVLRTDGPAGPPARRPQPDLNGLPALVATAGHAGLTATLSETGRPRPVPADLATTAYRIVQESLTNTVRHAHAEHLRVRLDWEDTRLRITVRDDGRGRATANGQGGGHGLVGMRERVAALGGELTTGPGPDGAGFEVRASLPLE